MGHDHLVQEVRALREAYAERFHYDLQAILDDLKELERQSGRQVIPPAVHRPVAGEPVTTPHEGA